MAMVSSLPASNFFENNKNTIRDSGSFSSILNGKEDNFIRKLADSNRNFSPAINADKNLQIQMGGKKDVDGEIGVFGAEKYFNTAIDDELQRSTPMAARNYQYNKDTEGYPDHQTRQKNRSATPSVHSETSWNSQTSLLQNVLRNSPRTCKSNKISGKNFLANFGCNCYCSDKTSVDVNEDFGEISFNKSANVQGKKPLANPLSVSNHNSLDELPNWIKEGTNIKKLEKIGTGSNRETCLTFRNSNFAGNSPLKVQFQAEEEEKERKSLEVFGSPVMGKRNKSFSIDRRLSLFSWDSRSQAKEIELSVNSSAIYNETDSDGSSDLFEIDSLTGKTNPFLARQASDRTASGCVSPTTCYAPSEASIEWSVVTASVADFSVMSDFDDRRSKTSPALRNGKTNTNNEIPKRTSNLLGCKSYKAVRVDGDAHRISDKVNPNHVQMRRRPEFFVPVTKHEAEVKRSFVPVTKHEAEVKRSFVPVTKHEAEVKRSHPSLPSLSPRVSNMLHVQ